MHQHAMSLELLIPIYNLIFDALKPSIKPIFLDATVIFFFLSLVTTSKQQMEKKITSDTRYILQLKPNATKRQPLPKLSPFAFHTFVSLSLSKLKCFNWECFVGLKRLSEALAYLFLQTSKHSTRSH